ncbi:MAG: class I SAM-dependent methyltransferase [Thermoleophilaceae bacterium]|nr:class I SAM-dependent methyltransferase [Thermoleophilaceae bacterium]
MSAAPFPPLELANRVGSLEGAEDPYAFYDQVGRRTREDIVAALPAEWSFEGRSVLDFGCGAGRTLRHFLPETASAEVWGCDIDADSVAWIESELSPPLHVFRNGPAPPLDVESGRFDLIWALSVFTHLVETWSAWLLELHRVLKPGGILLATFMGEGMSRPMAGEDWVPDRVGMNVLRYGQGWELGGPMVFHSPWWIREHWGRAFEVLHLEGKGFATIPEAGQGVVVLRRLDVDLEPADLERIDPVEPREVDALLHGIVQSRREIEELRRLSEHMTSENAQLEARLATFEGSRSWALTKPLRLAGERLRARRGG